MDKKVEDIARVCHEANRAYCLSIGDASQVPWDEAPDWQKQSIIRGVQFHLMNPDATPSHGHDSWLMEKRFQGWKWGPTKDESKKEHPCFVNYSELPEEQKRKDSLFKSIVDALRDTEPTRAVWQFQYDAGNMGILSGIFVATTGAVQETEGKTAYFGEVLGKHSDIAVRLKYSYFTKLSDDITFVKQFSEFGCSTGYNPLEYL